MNFLRKTKRLFALCGIALALFAFASCGTSDYLHYDANRLIVEDADPNQSATGTTTTAGNTGGTSSVSLDDESFGYQDIPTTGDGVTHPLFSGRLGAPIATTSIENVTPDVTGQKVTTDYDGDGIPNDQEIVTNPFVADYPRIVARITAPVTMEIRISESSADENYSETINETDFKDTISNSMEDRHYTSANEKTTPYVTKDSQSEGGKHSESYGYQNSDSSKKETSVGASLTYGVVTVALNGKNIDEKAKSRAENSSIEDDFNRSTMSETTVFENIDYVDNQDKNGVEFKNDTVKKVTNNYRQSQKLKNNLEIGPNAGIVRAALYLKNPTLDMPAKIANVICTLSFRTPNGKFLPIKTFKLRNNDYSEFTQSIYGGEELGPYTIEVADLNTAEVKTALKNGYVPQIHVVSYDIKRVDDSNYNPGVENLKIVEEIAKARTATIKIIGSGMRETYRVAAFDVDEYGALSPGISLKKALFNILSDRIGSGEKWQSDASGQELTVSDENLKWKLGARDAKQYIYSANKTGNAWRKFETFVKSYEDAYNNVHHIETIKRIDFLSQFNPFDKKDNPNYNPNELLSRDDILKMKFWVVMHNGRYFEGDLNDPIWAGERFEIVCMDMLDFNEHFERYTYTPLQTSERVFVDTRWNRLTEEKGEFARATYLGKVLANETVQLEIDLLESRHLFADDETPDGFGAYDLAGGAARYYNFKYTFAPEDIEPTGIPEAFKHSVQGGVNTIRVTIQESVNARGYEISFYPKDTPANKRTITVTRTELAAKNNEVVISSQTPGIGTIDGASGEGLAYRVDVVAVGLAYNNTVRTKSGSTSNIAYVLEANEKPHAFDFGVAGLTNTINVRIATADNAEYYIIRYSGPHNYAVGDVTVKEIVGYSGFNSISVDSPSVSQLADKNYEPGLFSIEVFARNKLQSGYEIVSYSGTQWITVLYDKYQQQRKYAPKISDALFDLSAVDLQVNFNDGSGWYFLQTTDPFNGGTLQSADASKVIDTYYNSYFDQNKRKFFISFIPPDGKQYPGCPNVYFGGRGEVDLYVRTIPKKQYRDSFWMLPPVDNTGKRVDLTAISQASRYLSFADLAGQVGNPDFDIVSYWMQLDRGTHFTTDAVNFETALADFQSVGISTSGMFDDFFFSPATHRYYALRATASDQTQLTPGYRPDMPGYHSIGVYVSIAANNYISITNMASSRTNTYLIYHTTGSKTADEQKQYKNWGNPITLPANVTSTTVPNLNSDTVYTVCVVGQNKYGDSDPNCQTATIAADPAISPEAPGTPSVGSITPRYDGIFFADVYAANTEYFILYWKRSVEIGNDVGSQPWRTVTFGGSSVLLGIPSDIWGTILVRLYAYNHKVGRSSGYVEYTLSPFTPIVANDFSVGWSDKERTFAGERFITLSIGSADCYDYNADIAISPYFPAGTVEYSVAINMHSNNAQYHDTDVYGLTLTGTGPNGIVTIPDGRGVPVTRVRTSDYPSFVLADPAGLLPAYSIPLPSNLTKIYRDEMVNPTGDDATGDRGFYPYHRYYLLHDVTLVTTFTFYNQYGEALSKTIQKSVPTFQY